MEAKVRSVGTSIEIFDRFRGKFVSLTPEEWVRQHFAAHLVANHDVPASRVLLEAEIVYGRMAKRPDLSVMGSTGGIWLLAEFKAADVPMGENVWQQAAAYASVLKPKFMALSNGISHIYAEFRPELGTFVFIENLPKHTLR